MNHLNFISSILVILVHFSVTLVECSHFRGAIMSWMPDGSGGITINYRISWRLSSYGAYCDDNIINSGQVILRDYDYLECEYGCSDTIGKLNYRCTGYSPTSEDNWSSGLGSLSYTPPSGVTTFTLGFLPLVNDVDGDTVRCRWAATYAECGDACGLSPVLTLDQNACTLTYDPVAAASYPATMYIVALQIEDFATASSNTPLSSIPAQFLLRVFNSPEPCGSGPEFIVPTPEDCVIAKPGESMTLTIKARSKTSLKAITTTSAIGMQRSPIVLTSDDTWNYISLDIQWTPLSSDIGSKRVVCFFASDSNGLTSETKCVKVLVAACEPPVPANGNFIETFTSSCEYKGQYTCDHGYEVIGAAEVTCDASGQWDSPPSVCQLIDCGQPQAPINGQVEYQLTTYGAIATFECDRSYKMTGQDAIECLSSGSWNATAPACARGGSSEESLDEASEESLDEASEESLDEDSEESLEESLDESFDMDSEESSESSESLD